MRRWNKESREKLEKKKEKMRRKKIIIVSWRRLVEMIMIIVSQHGKRFERFILLRLRYIRTPSTTHVYSSFLISTTTLPHPFFLLFSNIISRTSIFISHRSWRQLTCTHSNNNNIKKKSDCPLPHRHDNALNSFSCLHLILLGEKFLKRHKVYF